MIREIKPTDGQVHVYNDTHTLLIAEPGLMRLHHKACGGLMLIIPLEMPTDTSPYYAMYHPCLCKERPQTPEPIDRERVVAETYSDLYKMIRATCCTAEDVLRLLERLSSPSRCAQEAF